VPTLTAIHYVAASYTTTFTPRQVVRATNQPIFNKMPAGGTEKTAQRTVLAFAAEIVGDFCKKKL